MHPASGGRQPDPRTAAVFPPLAGDFAEAAGLWQNYQVAQPRLTPATGGIVASAGQERINHEVTCGTGEDENMNQLITELDEGSKKSDIPEFRPGDSVRVHVRVVEGSKSRIQVFAGAVIARTGSGIQEAFTVRKVSYGTGVERTFPLHSPIIDKIEVERRGDVRRAKLYYLRGRRGKAAKIKERRDS